MCSGELVCVQGSSGGPFCTRFCSGGDCPSGWACIGVNSNQGAVNLCLPGAEGGGDSGFGERCSSGPDCASGLCVTDGQTAFCTELCMDDSGCPGDATCASLPSGGGACVPGGGVSSGGYGDPCNDESQCESGLCISDGTNVYCSDYCTQDGECPTGSACYALEDGSGACVIEESPSSPSTPTQGFDEPCEGDSDCVSDLCVDDGSRTFCSELCDESTPCPQGATCVEYTSGGGACLPGTSEPEPSACGSDADCAGSMVCQGGDCVEPSADPAPQGGASAGGGSSGPIDPPPSGGVDDEDQEITPAELGCATQGDSRAPLSLLLLALLCALRCLHHERSAS